MDVENETKRFQYRMLWNAIASELTKVNAYSLGFIYTSENIPPDGEAVQMVLQVFRRLERTGRLPPNEHGVEFLIKALRGIDRVDMANKVERLHRELKKKIDTPGDQLKKPLKQMKLPAYYVSKRTAKDPSRQKMKKITITDYFQKQQAPALYQRFV